MTEAEREEYFKWYCHYHTHFPNFLLCENIATVEKDGVLWAEIMVYPILGSKLCMFLFITRNPFCDKVFSSDAVDYLVNNLKSVTKSLGYDAFVSVMDEVPAIKRFEKSGALKFPKPMTVFFGECNV
jgi:hypothetical protein